ncbi:hypothetical protein MKX03_022364 [Papaver bracteatum]|nr:hypothetical protein MKX03_022364 [Papaver bracteatum]
MASLPPYLAILLFLRVFVFCHGANQIPKAYIVYMGSSNHMGGEVLHVEATKSSHLKLLSSVIPSQESERLSLIHSYNHGFKGFSAVLTEEEAAILSEHDEIVSIFADTTLQMHTTRSWDFLESESGILSNHHHHHQYPLHALGEDVIIGIIDTGKLKGYGQNPQVLRTMELEKFHQDGKEFASKDLVLKNQIVTGSLDSKKAAGKIIVCVSTDPTVSRRIKKLVVEGALAKGMILINEAEKGAPFESGVFPFSQMGDVDGAKILKYIKATKNPMVTILPTVEVSKAKPAPVVASFSSRGPGGLTETILKPHVAAPGVAILAAMIPPTKGSVPPGKRPSKFAIKSGTSMACPHVAGAAAFIKSVHPDWSTSMIKSALMTTAIASDNIGKPITNSSNAFASPHEMGAGEMIPLRALNPGLVFETTTKDYLHFLCYYGYKKKMIISSISGSKFTCPTKSSEDFISDLNYPSISISKLKRRGKVRTITRIVTNVGHGNATYVAKLHSPRSGLIIKVSPEKLVFTEYSRKASFKVSFNDKGKTKGYKFGSVTWSDHVHFVRVVFAVNVV